MFITLTFDRNNLIDRILKHLLLCFCVLISQGFYNKKLNAYSIKHSRPIMQPNIACIHTQANLHYCICMHFYFDFVNSMLSLDAFKKKKH